MEHRTRRLIIVLADISGYTSFMLANQLSLVHGQLVITSLLEAIIREVEIPLEVKEIEGDAVFVYAAHPGDEERWREICQEVGRKLLRFFEVFAEALVTAGDAAFCRCQTCKNVEELKLKVVVHSGEALFHRIDRFQDVSGVDVILAHRLLKNSLASDEYLLLTDAARRDLDFHRELRFEKHEEAYEGFGTVTTHVHLLGDPRSRARRQLDGESFGRAAARGVTNEVRSLFGQFGHIPKSAALAQRNQARSSSARRALVALLMLVALPLELLLVPVVVPLQMALRRRRRRVTGAR